MSERDRPAEDDGRPARAVEAPRGGSPADRRRDPRIPAPPMQVSGECRNIMDVSLGGICLDLESPLESGACYLLLMTDALHYHTQELKARVIWRDEGRIGLQWEDLTDRQRRWLEARLSDWDREGLRAHVRAKV